MQKNVFRDKYGQYDYSNMELMCECGHKLGVHSGENDTKKRPCFNEDSGLAGATGKKCSCKTFRLKK